ncbi:MAG: hypothetical protein FWC16_04675 [Defluviitaleaceae bacterium]|nr:hypothetical protein [Defluviitaleaceae bacterium]MCL2274201.1 hypothetical protein [Defluviitaleaceae bacterium]
MDFFKKMDVKRWASYAGSLLMVASLGFIVRRIFLTHGDVDFSVFYNPVIVMALLGVALLEGAGIIMASFNYRAMVAHVSGIRVKTTLAMVVYTMSNVYKYIPGGVMYVLGRNKIAVDTEDLSHAKVAVATVLEGASIAIAAVTIAIVFSFEHSMYYIRQMENLAVIGVIVLIVIWAAIPIIYRFRHKINAQWRDIKDSSNKLRPSLLLVRLCVAFVLMFLWAFTFLATLMLLGQEMTLGLGITVMGLYMLSWVAGFLTPGAPSGLGVREVVMLMFMGGALNEGILISAMVMHRMLTVIGDLSAYGIALAYAGAKKRLEQEA